MLKILIVDDDPRIRQLVSVNLEAGEFEVAEAVDGNDAYDKIRQFQPDIIILDLMLPGASGVEIAEWVRTSQDTPIIVLSARDEEDQKVKALEAGADDYITKPFGRSELLARLNALIRRAKLSGVIIEKRMEIGDMMIDYQSRRVTVKDEDTRMTRTEFALLAQLAQNLDSIVTHDDLLMRVWGPEYRGSNHYLHVYLGRVRKKLGEDYSRLLETVSGQGYILHSPDTYQG